MHRAVAAAVTALAALGPLLSPHLVAASGGSNELTTLADHARLYDDVPLGPGSRIGLYAPSFPWTFGPYQMQMYLVSVYLHEQGFETVWLCSAKGSAVRPGEWPTLDALKRDNPEIQVVEPWTEFGPVDHLSFAGTIVEDEPSQNVIASQINTVAIRYKLDAMMMLRDTSQILPDAEFVVPMLGWFPIHTHGAITRGQYEHWVLRNFHALAALAPASMKDQVEGLSDDIRAGTITIDFVPHIISRPLLQKRVQATAERVDPGPARYTNGGVAAGSDNEGSCLNPDACQDPNMARRKKEAPLKEFLKSPNGAAETFLVHIKGCNYNKEDRKGWDPALQAYKRFYERVEEARQDDPSMPPTHLYIHAVPSYLIESDNNGGADPPPQLMPQGMNLRLRAYRLGLPRETFTLDETIHDVETVAYLQAMGSVCLLPTRVEGFGMNILECQAVGTPVVTTNHTATGDFCRFGKAVPYQQYHFSPHVNIEFAQPDVTGITDALWDFYLQHTKRLQEQRAGTAQEEASLTSDYIAKQSDAMQWIDDEFSTEVVGGRLVGLLQAAARNFAKRQKWIKKRAQMAHIKSGALPTSYVVYDSEHVEYANRGPEIEWVILTPPNIEFDHTALRQVFSSLLGTQADKPSVYIIPCDGMGGPELMAAMQEGKEIPLPIIFPVYYLTALQNLSTRRINLSFLALSNGQAMMDLKLFPSGIASRST